MPRCAACQAPGRRQWRVGPMFLPEPGLVPAGRYAGDYGDPAPEGLHDIITGRGRGDDDVMTVRNR